jgi:hypothetical protein
VECPNTVRKSGIEVQCKATDYKCRGWGRRVRGGATAPTTSKQQTLSFILGNPLISIPTLPKDTSVSFPLQNQHCTIVTPASATAPFLASRLAHLRQCDALLPDLGQRVAAVQHLFVEPGGRAVQPSVQRMHLTAPYCAFLLVATRQSHQNQLVHQAVLLCDLPARFHTTQKELQLLEVPNMQASLTSARGPSRCGAGRC